MGAVAGVWAEASTPNPQGHRNPRGWYGDIVEAGRVQAKKAIKKGYFREESGEKLRVQEGNAIYPDVGALTSF